MKHHTSVLFAALNVDNYSFSASNVTEGEHKSTTDQPKVHTSARWTECLIEN